MKLNDKQTKSLIDILAANADVLQIEIRSYSGRGMFGQECLGVITEAPEKFTFRLGVLLALAEFELAEAMFSVRWETDSIGRTGTVIYWPTVSTGDESWLSPFLWDYKTQGVRTQGTGPFSCGSQKARRQDTHTQSERTPP